MAVRSDRIAITGPDDIIFNLKIKANEKIYSYGSHDNGNDACRSSGSR